MDAAKALRRSLIVLTVIGVVGTAIELAMERHWKTGVQLVPWFTLGAIAVAVVLLVARPGRRSVLAVRAIVVAVFIAAAFGVYEHIDANYEAGPLDFRYSAKWETMSTADRWWAAATNGVGPSPPLTPAVLAQAALCLGLATIQHPALTREEGEAVPEPVRA